MTREVEEAYLEWLDREEESLGKAATVRLSADFDAAKEMLWGELGYEPADTQIEALMRAGEMRYKIMPEIGVSFERIEHVWGKQSTYRDIMTGRFISSTAVEQALATLGL